MLSIASLERTLFLFKSNAVEVHIHHLRKKLGKDIVRTVNKIGYILEET